MAEKSARSKEVDNNDLNLDQVKEQLLELGKKKGSLSLEKIAARLGSFELDSDHMDEFYEFLGEHGVEILTDGEEEDDDDPNEKNYKKKKSLI